MVYRLSPSGVGGQFIGTTGTMGIIGGDSGNSTTSFDTLGTFLFQTVGISVLVAPGDFDLLRRL